MIELTLTALLVFITGIYACFTYRILKANQNVVKIMQSQYEAIYRPYVTISPVLFPAINIFYLRIKNSGLTAAEDLCLKIDKDFFRFGEKQENKNLRNYAAFNNPIAALPPESELLFYLAQDFKIFGNNIDSEVTPSDFVITAKYAYGEKKFCETTTIDLKPYLESALPHDPIVSHLEKIHDEIKKSGTAIVRSIESTLNYGPISENIEKLATIAEMIESQIESLNMRLKTGSVRIERKSNIPPSIFR